MASPEPDPRASAAGGFPVTLWTVVLNAGDSGSERAAEALSRLCSAYWYPIYAFLRRLGRSPHDAEDLTQSFLAGLLERRAMEQVRREKGRFRSFLLACLGNFLSDEWDRSRAARRGGGAEMLSLEHERAEERYLEEPADSRNPEKLFELRWATTVLDHSLQRLRAEFSGSGRQERFAALEGFLDGADRTVSYAATAERLGMSEGAVKVAVLRMRQRYRDLVRDEVLQTVGSEAEAEAEMRHLLDILAGN